MKKKTATKSSNATYEESFSGKASELIERLKEIIAEGNARQIVVEDKSGKVLFTIPVTFGIFGALIAPGLAALGAVAAVVAECTIRVEK